MAQNSREETEITISGLIKSLKEWQNLICIGVFDYWFGVCCLSSVGQR